MAGRRRPQRSQELPAAQPRRLDASGSEVQIRPPAYVIGRVAGRTYHQSGRLDLNQRPPAPKAGALARLSYAPPIRSVIIAARLAVENTPRARGPCRLGSAPLPSPSSTGHFGLGEAVGTFSRWSCGLLPSGGHLLPDRRRTHDHKLDRPVSPSSLARGNEQRAKQRGAVHRNASSTTLPKAVAAHTLPREKESC